MRKLGFFYAILLSLSLLSACSGGHMNGEMRKKAFRSIPAIAKEPENGALSLLEETETALGMHDFKAITGINSVLQNVDCIVRFETADETDYYALYARMNGALELVRIRRDNLLDGDLVYTRGERDCRFYIKEIDRDGCSLVLENWNGALLYELAYELESLTDEGEWKLLAEVPGTWRSKIEQESREYHIAWPSETSLPSGRYRLTLPVVCLRVEWKPDGQSGERYTENIRLSCEFDLE